MNEIEWTQVFPAAAIGAAVGWLLRYVFVRWYEKRHLDEELDRGVKAMSLAEKLFALHEKACDRNVSIAIPLGKRVVELLPTTDDELAEQEQQRLVLMEVGQCWLVSLMWHCVNLQQIKAEPVSVDDAMMHAEECFVSAYELMDANALMRDYGDITLTQLVHAYHGYITQKTDATAEAVLQAMDNWMCAHPDNGEGGGK